MDDLLTALLRRDTDVFQDLPQRRRELSRDLIAASLFTDRHGEPGAADGLWFEPALFMTRPTVLRRLVGVLGLLIPTGIDRLVGTEPGSLAIVSGLALETGLPFVALREIDGAWHAHGELHPGERVMVIEDVTNTGARLLSAARALTGSGATVVEARSVIDNDRGARDALAAAGVVFEPLFDLQDLLAQHENGGAR
ncbi:orotate phosphoribosyltransferase [Microbacterium marinilacus]|uniref:orotate phosphoribosyltransferase n=1 Tax=Microbacterium marinilacus TaxID=415209 RepID=UPI001C8EA8F8|nr:hypothetical protein [Microbacterium marinilacus]MBY0688234.1 hypothetical protein [Microbacterium marinilacus]